ncbi:MAG: hypothetical protein J6126_04470 [Clostridia bacterium]|nr:hypothetical protein [Clostridia bacterium]
MRIYNFPRQLIYESIVTFVGITIFPIPCFVEAKGTVGLIIAGITFIIVFIVFEIFAILKYTRDISVISEEKIVQIFNKKVVRELRREDIRKIIILYIPKGSKNIKIIVDDGSYKPVKRFLSSSMGKNSEFTFCFLDYTKAREEYIEKCWPDIPVERRATRIL